MARHLTDESQLPCRHFQQCLSGFVALAVIFGTGCLAQNGLDNGGGGSDGSLTVLSGTATSATTSTTSGTVSKPAQTTPIHDSDLIAYWPFDDGNEFIAADLSGNGHDGNLLGAQPSPGVSGLGIAFTGDGSGVDIADGPDFELKDSFTIEAWFNATSLHDGHNLIFFRGDSRPGLDPYFVTIYPDRTLRFAIQNEANDVAWATAPISLGEFHHMAAVFDSQLAALNLYVDGKLRTTTFTSIKPMQRLVSTEGPGIGIGHHAMRTGNDYGFIGTIDEVRLYRRALSATEVNQHFSAPHGSSPAIM